MLLQLSYDQAISALRYAGSSLDHLHLDTATYAPIIYTGVEMIHISGVDLMLVFTEEKDVFSQISLYCLSKRTGLLNDNNRKDP